jgi:hypothetical protein
MIRASNAEFAFLVFAQLYSAGFAILPIVGSEGPCGGIDRLARLKIEFRRECWSDSGQGHQELRNHL